MEHSEKLALTGILARINPRCAVEVETFQGGSLSLIAQYSQLVFSIDIDPEIPGKFRQFSNVSFITGPSVTILPGLFIELDAAALYPDFVLIYGDPSKEGIRGDIECVLDYQPKVPMFVMIHDSFNPGCRAGIVQAEWSRSLYVQWIDVDFIPGRLIEHGGEAGGQCWGGLAMAYLTPQQRIGEAKILSSAARMQKIIVDFTEAK